MPLQQTHVVATTKGGGGTDPRRPLTGVLVHGRVDGSSGSGSEAMHCRVAIETLFGLLVVVWVPFPAPSGPSRGQRVCWVPCLG
jgi:hypothetical protein